jgi:hypothetical protein
VSLRAITAGRAQNEISAYKFADASAEARALRGLEARTSRVILAGKLAKVSTAGRGASAVSLCQRNPCAAASLALPTHALLPIIAAVRAAAAVALVSLEVYAIVFTSGPPCGDRPPSAQATPGMEAKAAPRRAPPIHLIALPLESVPFASPLANSSKEVPTPGPGLVSTTPLVPLFFAIRPVPLPRLARLCRSQRHAGHIHSLDDPRTLHFDYPGVTRRAEDLCGRLSDEGREVYQCAHLLTAKRRIKACAASLTACYVDADGAKPTANMPRPTAAVISSSGREQYWWPL